MPRHREVSVQVWDDKAFGALSKPKANAQTLWLRLLCGPETTPIPGVVRAGLASLAEALDWTIRDTTRCWEEISALNMASADWKARVIWLPNAFKHRGPRSEQDVKGWRRVWAELPECDLRAAIDNGVTAALKGYHQKLQDAWHTPNGLSKATPKDSANTSANTSASATASATARPSTNTTANTTPNGSTLHEEERKKGRDQKQDQDPGLAAGIAPCGNVEKSPRGGKRRDHDRPQAHAHLALEILDSHERDDEPYRDADWKADICQRCADLGLPYNSDSVRKSMDAAQAMRDRRAKQSA